MSVREPTVGHEPQQPLPLPISADEESATVGAVQFRAPTEDIPRYTVVSSPLGELLLVGDGYALTGLFMAPEQGETATVGSDWRADPALFTEAEEQLRAYFAGELRVFDVPLAPRGTTFQRQVWQALTTIPYGRTATYAAIAAKVGRPTAFRAVGLANGRNPISVVVPCHRVIGSDGTLTGYGGGLGRKRQLLDLERGGRRAD